MAVLGKRKAGESSVSAADAEEIFRRHFEAQFDPLDIPEAQRTAEDDDVEGEDAESQDEGDEWSGLSDGGGDDTSGEAEEEALDDKSRRRGARREVSTVEVVDHSAAQAPKQESMSKRELRAFMSSRPPDQSSPSTTPATQSKAAPSSTLPEDAPSLLAQDLELRRLISESHLLNPKPASFSSASNAEAKAFTSGRIRQQATDLRIQALGSKTSILKQEKMPMNMRKGMVAAADAREAKRRREAKENGIVLEREAGKKNKKRARREEIDRPGVGRMRGAELRISDRDVRSIEGTKDVFGRRTGGKRR